MHVVSRFFAMAFSSRSASSSSSASCGADGSLSRSLNDPLSPGPCGQRSASSVSCVRSGSPVSARPVTNYSADSPLPLRRLRLPLRRLSEGHFDLAMDLALLTVRQLRSHDQPFRRGSPAMETVACELENLSPTQFGGVTKKAIRDRVMKLLELFAQT